MPAKTNTEAPEGNRKPMGCLELLVTAWLYVAFRLTAPFRRKERNDDRD